jgi:hypothetical protein
MKAMVVPRCTIESLTLTAPDTNESPQLPILVALAASSAVQAECLTGAQAPDQVSQSAATAALPSVQFK